MKIRCSKSCENVKQTKNARLRKQQQILTFTMWKKLIKLLKTRGGEKEEIYLKQKLLKAKK